MTTKTEIIPTLDQQGDVLLFSTEAIPDTAKLQKGLSVIHPGNTGNNHALAGPAFGIYVDGDRKWIDVAEPATLTHNEHKPITLTSGKYEMRLVQEYDHFSDLQRAVVD